MPRKTSSRPKTAAQSKTARRNPKPARPARKKRSPSKNATVSKQEPKPKPKPKALAVHRVEPDRFKTGYWCERRHRMIGIGDIRASYSAAAIAANEPVRKPFTWQGHNWISVGETPHDGASSVKAYRLIHPRWFDGEVLPYDEKSTGERAEQARRDPNGFYHGMSVRFAGVTMVLCGPPVLFSPGPKRQLELF